MSIATFTYKRVGPLEMKLDVYSSHGTVQRPVAVWIHGGALMYGRRESIPVRVKEPLLEAGYAVVSIDYRLAPETKLSMIIEDVVDAFQWIRVNGRAKFGGDTDSLAVLGSSAGGYLTLVSGYRLRPRPAVLVSFWGYGDLVGTWYSEPSPHHRVNLSREEAYEQVSGSPISNSVDRVGDGDAFYLFCRQHGLWPQEVSGWDPRSEADRFVPYMPLRNVDKDFPPTLLIHGIDDTDVPYQQSVMMTEQFMAAGVEHEFVAVSGAGHNLAGGKPSAVDDSYESAIAFVKTYLNASTQ